MLAIHGRMHRRIRAKHLFQLLPNTLISLPVALMSIFQGLVLQSTVASFGREESKLKESEKGDQWRDEVVGLESNTKSEIIRANLLQQESGLVGKQETKMVTPLPFTSQNLAQRWK